MTSIFKIVLPVVFVSAFCPIAFASPQWRVQKRAGDSPLCSCNEVDSVTGAIGKRLSGLYDFATQGFKCGAVTGVRLITVRHSTDCYGIIGGQPVVKIMHRTCDNWRAVMDRQVDQWQNPQALVSIDDWDQNPVNTSGSDFHDQAEWKEVFQTEVNGSPLYMTGVVNKPEQLEEGAEPSEFDERDFFFAACKKVEEQGQTPELYFFLGVNDAKVGVLDVAAMSAQNAEVQSTVDGSFGSADMGTAKYNDEEIEATNLNKWITFDAISMPEELEVPATEATLQLLNLDATNLVNQLIDPATKSGQMISDYNLQINLEFDEELVALPEAPESVTAVTAEFDTPLSLPAKVTIELGQPELQDPNKISTKFSLKGSSAQLKSLIDECSAPVMMPRSDL